ncbi:MAG TPA: hypothetical protein VJA94_10780 [Candidatus Angelobacter sp.]
MLMIVVCSSILVRGQEQQEQEEDEFSEDSKVNTNIAIPLSVPLNPIARFVNFGWGVTIGAGYNLSRRNALIGEFMYNRLAISSAALAPLRLALHSRDLSGSGNLYAITANYRYELRGHKMGVYFIGGGGFYYRNANLSREVVTGTATTCTREWLFWGFSCTNGTVSSDQTLANAAVGSFGANGGIGITAKVAEPRYRFYIEARYHYAPATLINTQLIPITFGVRF